MKWTGSGRSIFYFKISDLLSIFASSDHYQKIRTFIFLMKLYGLIGQKLGHSFSASIFNSRFQKNHTDARYDLFELPDISYLPSLLDSHPEIAGFNVTVPYKEKIIPFLDETNEEARETGAVNCVTVSYTSAGNRILTGYNTDIAGISRILAPFLPMKGHDILILGSGGASKAVVAALRNIGANPIVVSRNPSEKQISYDDINAAMVKHMRCVIQTTPLGMWPDVTSAPAFPYHLISPDHVCIDLVYNPAVTEFMRLCASQGATVRNGLSMLYGQAEENARIWGV